MAVAVAIAALAAAVAGKTHRLLRGLEQAPARVVGNDAYIAV